MSSSKERTNGNPDLANLPFPVTPNLKERRLGAGLNSTCDRSQLLLPDGHHRATQPVDGRLAGSVNSGQNSGPVLAYQTQFKTLIFALCRCGGSEHVPWSKQADCCGKENLNKVIEFYIKCGHARRFGWRRPRPSAGSGPRLHCISARPFAAAGHDPGPHRGRLHGSWWACWPDTGTFWLGRWSLSLQPPPLSLLGVV